jgi:hypothetical protein
MTYREIAVYTLDQLDRLADPAQFESGLHPC